MSRRDILVGAASAGAGLLAGSALARRVGQIEGSTASASNGFRFAHLTDLHIMTRRCAEKVQAAIHHAIDRPHAPELILTGGDLVFDTMYARERGARRQWKHVRAAFSSQISVPVEHVLGNHDIWGIDRDKSQTTGAEALYGKGLAMEELQMTNLYRSFDRGGWHFILLDDVTALPDQKTYEGRLDEAQFEWLAADLKATPSTQPTIVLSHIPILGASVFFPPQTARRTNLYSLPYSMMHGDAARVVSLFEQHPNVKLCLSGHTHLVDKVEYKGVTYMGNGAVCGNWWRGSFQGFEPGYSLVDLKSDGTFSSEYQHYQRSAEPIL